METIIEIILAVVFIGELFAIYVKGKGLIITLGNLGDPWVRVPQNTVLAITKHKSLIKLLYSVSDIMLSKVQDEKGLKKKFEEDEKYTIIPKQKGGLYFMGFSFAGFDVYEWFETKEDEEDGINALHSIDLAEQVIEYLPQEAKKRMETTKKTSEGETTEEKRIVSVEESEHDPLYGVPSFKSADNIEIRTSLTVYFIVVNPEKALFNVRYRKKALQDQIFPVWRDTIGEFSFFVYERGKDEEESEKIVIDPAIKTKTNDWLRKKLGIIKNKTERRGVANNLFLEEWGIWLRDVTVGELEAGDPEIESALASQMKARTDALAEIERAIGSGKSFDLIGSGKAKAITRILKAFAGDAKEKVSEAIQAFLVVRQFEALEAMPKDGRQIIYQWPNAGGDASTLTSLLKKLDQSTLEKILNKIR